jgi:lysophospholipase L1-like esterase
VLRRIVRNRLVAGTVVITAAALPAVTIAAPAAAQSSVNYVALGDSYASGVGAGDYTSAGGSCDQSTNAYSALWAAANDPASYVTEACSGATTEDVISSQLSALSSSTTLVSVTVGGNNVGFSSVMEDCVLLPTSYCVSDVNSAIAEAEADLPGDLNTMLADIAADAPNAKVVIVGYPEFYDLANSSTCIGLSTTDRTDLNQGAAVLDSLLQAAAQQNGDVFADVRPDFAGHQICDSDSYLNSVDWFDLGVSYHPTEAGQAYAYEPTFAAAAG